MEVWKDIEGFEGRYMISDKGRVKSLVTNRILKHGLSKSGYHGVSLRIDGTTRQFQVHRLVGQAFIPKQNDNLEINHINNRRGDNRVENLEWVTRKENVVHSIKYGNVLNANPRKDNTSGINGVTKNDRGKWVARIGFEGERIYLGIYDDFEEAKEARLQAEKKIKESV